jgi:hypothetical protein
VPEGVDPPTAPEAVAEPPAAAGRPWRVDVPSAEEGVYEPRLPVGPAVTVDWSYEPPAAAPLSLDGPVPFAPAEVHDELLTAIVAEAIPFLPRSLSAPPPVRKFVRVGGETQAPMIEPLETVLLTAAFPPASGYVFLDAADDGLSEIGEPPVAGDTIGLEDDGARDT